MKKIFLLILITLADSLICHANSITLTQRGKEFLASNKFYQLNFSKTGAINEIMFKNSGKGIKSNYLSHDGLALNASKSFMLRKDALYSGTINAISDREKQLILKVSYPKTASKVTASYTYTFYADKPIIKVSISIQQQADNDWLLLRLNEFGTENDFFTNWAVGEDEKSGLLANDKGTQKATNWKVGYSWSVLYNDEDALGIIGENKARSFIYIYGPKKQYINGRYGRWNTRKLTLDQYLYIGSSDNSYKLVQTWAEKIYGSQ